MILKFKEFDNINDVEPFRKKCLLVTRDQAVPLEEDEYFIADLIGLRVITDEDKGSESLLMSLRPGANDVYQVTDENGKASPSGNQRLYSFRGP